METIRLPLLIKIEPNTGIHRANDGGFEALLDEFGPENNQSTSLIKFEPEDQNSSPQTEPYSNQISHLQNPTNRLASLRETNKNNPKPPGVNNNNKKKKKKANLNKKRRNLKRSILKAASQICPSVASAQLVSYTNFEGVILPKAFPKVTLTEEQANQVQQQLVKFMLEDPTLVAELWYPRFNHCYFKDGAIFFDARDFTTRRWVITTLPKLSLFLGINLHVIKVTDFPIFVKVEAWVKNLTLDDSQLLKLMEKQNGGSNQPFNTHKWIICERSDPTERGTRLVIGIDQESLKFLKNMQEIFLGLGKVEFVLPAEKDVPPNPMIFNGAVPPMMGPILTPPVQQQPTSSINNFASALNMYNLPLWNS